MSALERLRAQPGVLDCALVKRADGVRIAYVVATRAIAFSDAHIDFCVPVARIPLTAAGEVDESALRAVPVLEPAVLERVRELCGPQSQIAREPVGEIEAPHIVPALPAPCDTHAHFGEPLSSVSGGELPVIEGWPALLSEALVRAARSDARVTFVEADGAERVGSYRDLLTEARHVATGLRAERGERVLVLTQRPRDVLVAFWGCQWAARVPAIVAVPRDWSEGSAAVARLRVIWELLDGPSLIADPQAHAELARALPGARCLALDTLRASDPTDAPAPATADQVALLTFTSGSTGAPKCIPLTHRNLLDRALGTASLCGQSRDDVALNWLPLDHIGSISDWHVRCVALACHAIYVATDHVLGAPERWLELLARHRASHSWAPNFVYASLADGGAESAARRGLDLSAVRCLLTAGEAVSAPAVARFTRALAPVGLATDAVRPAFGMAEMGSGVTYCLDAGRHLHVDRAQLAVGRPVAILQPRHPRANVVADVGAPIARVELRIAGDSGAPLAERTVGHLLVRGAPVFSGYLATPEINRDAFVDGWFRTGDLGFLADGRLYLTGRAKETIIVNGCNYGAAEIEAVVARVDGVLAGHVAAASMRAEGDEELVVFLAAAAGRASEPDALAGRVRAALARSLGITPHHVVLVAPEQIGKTSIGKIRRAELVRQLESGELSVTGASVARSASQVPDWFHERVFVPRALPATDGVARACVLIGGPPALAAALLARLGASSRIADGFSTDGHPVDEVIYLGAAGAPREHELALATDELLSLARALPPGVALTCVTRGAESVHASDVVLPERAALLALVRTLSVEHQRRVRCIDIDGGDVGAVAGQIAGELARGSDQAVIYRSGRRLVPRLARLSGTPTAGHALRRGGRYLVTGGLGGIGRELVRQLLASYDARVLLAVREPLDGERAETVAALSRLGGRLTTQVLDARDPFAVARLVEDTLGGLDGVFHLAGGYHARPLAQENADSIVSLVHSKSQTAESLTLLVAAHPGAFLVMFSSVASQQPAAGLGAYAAASAYLDALGQAQRSTGVAACVVGWSAWVGLGMASDTSAAQLASQGLRPIDPDQGLASLRLLLAHPRPHVLVGLDLNHPRVRALRTDSALAVEHVVARVLGPAPAMAPLCDRFGTPVSWQAATVARLAVPSRAPEGALEVSLARIWEEVLERSPIGACDSFFELGGSSLKVVLLCARIESQLGARLAPGVLFEAPTVAQLAEHIARERHATPRYLVRLADGAATPLFVVASAYGSVFELEPLARRIGEQRPVYAFQSPAVCGEACDRLSIETLARTYLAELRAAQPRGPYLLAGYCAGGVVAYEVARQLTQAGDTVASLTLIGTALPTSFTRAERLIRSARYHARAVRRRGLGVHLRSLISKTKPDRYQAAWQHMNEALAAYRPGLFRGDVTLFVAGAERASRLDPAGFGAPPEQWGRMIDGQLAVQPVAGDHLAILKPPMLDAWVGRLSEMLEHACKRAMDSASARPLHPQRTAGAGSRIDGARKVA